MARSSRKRKQQVKWLVAIVISASLLLFLYLWWVERQTTFIRYKEFGISIPSNYQMHGIDVSRYQRFINWKAVQSMNIGGIRIEYVFIKATEGTDRVDLLFQRNWHHAKKAGLYRGAYHFFIASRDGAKQAKRFLNTVALAPGDLPPVLDIEQQNGTPREILQQRVRDWLHEVEAVCKCKPIIYTNARFYVENLAGEFDDYPLWVAHYLQPYAPRVSRDWVFWQHSESGHVNGISGKVDFNVFNGDSTQFTQLLLK